MDNIEESKDDCKCDFMLGSETVAGKFDGTMHLFEHTYDSNTRFWWGVADIACEAKEHMEWFREGTFRQRGEPRILIEFSDGRVGLFKEISGQHDAGTLNVALVGTQPAMPRPS